MINGPKECGQRRTFLLLCAGERLRALFHNTYCTETSNNLRAEETMSGVTIYLLIIGDRVRACLVSSLGDFAGAHFLALSLAQRREWLRLARPLRLTAS